MGNRDAGWLLILAGFVLVFLTGPIGFFVMALGVLLMMFEKRRKCWRCGATWRRGQSYCTRCGAKLEAP